jgi:hypothetical protein
MYRRAGILARLMPKVPEKGPTAVETLNTALGAAAAFLVLGGEFFRFLRERRDQRKRQEAEDEV